MSLAYGRYGPVVMAELYSEYYIEFGMSMDNLNTFRSYKSYKAAYKEYRMIFFIEHEDIEPADISDYKFWLRGGEGFDLDNAQLPVKILWVLMLEMEMEEIPLYINSDVPIAKFLSRWRMKVGK
jgi:hypothetical protein